MTIQKIKSGRITSIVADEYVGEAGIIFYNQSIGDLRLSDGVTIGGIPINIGSGGGNTSTIISATPPSTITPGTLWWDPTTGNMYIRYNNIWQLIPTVGSQGPIGLTGAQGLKGDTGAQGLKGDTGAQGPGVRMFNLFGNLVPTTGTVRWYPTTTITITSMFLTVGVTSTSDITLQLKINTTIVGSVTLTANSYKSSTQTINLTMSSTDYMTADLLTTGGENLTLTLEYNS